MNPPDAPSPDREQIRIARGFFVAGKVVDVDRRSTQKLLDYGLLLASELARVEQERDRETVLRREAERHNADLVEALDAKPYPDEVEWLQAELEASRLREDGALTLLEDGRAERDRLRELALAVVDTEGCCTGKILDAMDRLRAALEPTP